MRWTRSWFLLLVLVGLLLVWLWPAAVQWTTYLQPTITGAVAVFLSAWAIETRRLVGAIARPIPALLAIGISYLVLPVLSWLGFFVIANADFRIGLLLITCVPCTLVSAVIWTRLGGGNEAVALLVTTLSNGLSWLITTGWLLLAAEVSQVSFDQTAGLMGQLIIVLVVPMLAGQLWRTVPYMAAFGERRQTLLAVTGRLLVLGIMLKAAVEVRSKLEGEGGSVGGIDIALVAGACVLLHLVGVYLGLWISSWLGFDRPTRIAVAFSGSQKTLPVSLILFEEYFTAYPLAVLPIACFHLGQLVIDTLLAQRWNAAQGRGLTSLDKKWISSGA